MTLDPPDFIEKASVAEAWDESDWQQWRALRAVLEGLAVKSLRLYGPELLAAEGAWTFTRGSVRLNHTAPKPTLDALARLANQLQPPPPGTEQSPSTPK